MQTNQNNTSVTELSVTEFVQAQGGDYVDVYILPPMIELPLPIDFPGFPPPFVDDSGY